jgi:hypothetical protein
VVGKPFDVMSDPSSRPAGVRPDCTALRSLSGPTRHLHERRSKGAVLDGFDPDFITSLFGCENRVFRIWSTCWMA